MISPSVQPAFRDPPRDAQKVFRAVMDAMARPGRILPLEARFTPPLPLLGSAAAMALTLADYETPLWLDRVLAGAESVAAFLRFHTGARLVSEPAEASFALISDPANAPPLSAFAQGTPDYPDRSTTLIIEVERLSAEGWRLQGPGIAGETALGAAPLAADFGAQLVANRAQFPLGVDVIFAAPLAVAALPRSVQLVEAR